MIKDNFLFLIFGITMFIASIKTFTTKKIEGKGGLMLLGDYTDLASLVLFLVGIFLIWIGLRFMYKNRKKG